MCRIEWTTSQRKIAKNIKHYLVPLDAINLFPGILEINFKNCKADTIMGASVWTQFLGLKVIKVTLLLLCPMTPLILIVTPIGRPPSTLGFVHAYRMPPEMRLNAVL